MPIEWLSDDLSTNGPMSAASLSTIPAFSPAGLHVSENMILLKQLYDDSCCDDELSPESTDVREMSGSFKNALMSSRCGLLTTDDLASSQEDNTCFLEDVTICKTNEALTKSRNTKHPNPGELDVPIKAEESCSQRPNQKSSPKVVRACQVCRENASGNFFGALVCLPCKVTIPDIITQISHCNLRAGQPVIPTFRSTL